MREAKLAIPEQTLYEISNRVGAVCALLEKSANADANPASADYGLWFILKSASNDLTDAMAEAAEV